MTSKKHLLHIRPPCHTLLSIILALASHSAFGQSTPPAPLPPDAIDAVKRGIIASRQHDPLLAIRYFQEARIKAPEAPEIFVNLGLAESTIPGRELRAICWFEAYLAANPNARNAAVVKEQINTLTVKSHGNLSHLIKLLEDDVAHMPAHNQPADFSDVAILQAKSGDIPAARRTTDLIADAAYKSRALQAIADTQAEAGDTANARQTADLIEVPIYKVRALQAIASVQSDSGDFPGGDNTFVAAQDAIELIQEPKEKDRGQAELTSAQADAGYILRARKTADLIQDAGLKRDVVTHIDSVNSAGKRTAALRAIAEEQAKAGNLQSARGFLDSARKDADHVLNDSSKCDAMLAIAQDQARINDLADAQESLAAAQRIADLMANPADQASARKSITQSELTIRAALAESNPNSTASPILIHPAVFIWLARLDDDNSRPVNFDYLVGNDCPLNTDLFLDLPRALSALPASNAPQKLFIAHSAIAWKLVKAQSVIDEMLKHSAKD
jgi:hypothetical protein